MAAACYETSNNMCSYYPSMCNLLVVLTLEFFPIVHYFGLCLTYGDLNLDF
jgi:hypothetical protein